MKETKQETKQETGEDYFENAKRAFGYKSEEW